MMVSGAFLCFLLFSLLSGHADGTEDERKYWGKSPLPIFTRVEVKHNAEFNSTTITVRYKASERPYDRWFIDDIPFVGGMGNYFMLNSYDGFMLNMAQIIVPNDLGTRFKVCLQTKTTEAQNCLQLRPLRRVYDVEGQDVEFPWPLIVPSTLARYDSHEDRPVRIFAYQLDTWNYTHSAQFFFQDLAGAQSLEHLEVSQEGNPRDGALSIAPVTSGSPGWLVEVPVSDRAQYEGVMLFTTTIEPPQRASAIVERSISTRSIYIYNRAHSGPFPSNFAAMLPRDGAPLPVSCRTRDRLFCLIACPFVINGDLYDAQLSLARVYDDGARIVPLPRHSLSGLGRKMGEYLAEAAFKLSLEDGGIEDGVYRCSVSLGGHTSHTLLTVTIL
ncbi:hypothetical protein ACOMHN_013832 [Nucella lapillus]